MSTSPATSRKASRSNNAIAALVAESDRREDLADDQPAVAVDHVEPVEEIEAAAETAAGDIRRGMPRFQGENLPRNLQLLERFKAIAEREGCTPAQLSLAWTLGRGDHVVAIPGTTSVRHLEENVRRLAIDSAALEQVTDIFTPDAPAGPRYPAATQAEIDTEEFGGFAEMTKASPMR